MTKTFIEKSLKLKSGRTGSNGDDCPGLQGHPRGPGHELAHALSDRGLLRALQRTGGRRKQGRVHHRLRGQGQVSQAAGQGGRVLSAVYVAADDYKLSAEIDFTGQPNKEELEKLHGITSPGKKIKAETGAYTVRRFNKVAMSIEWPARKNSYEWDKIAGEFGKAFDKHGHQGHPHQEDRPGAHRETV